MKNFRALLVCLSLTAAVASCDDEVASPNLDGGGDARSGGSSGAGGRTDAGGTAGGSGMGGGGEGGGGAGGGGEGGGGAGGGGVGGTGGTMLDGGVDAAVDAAMPPPDASRLDVAAPLPDTAAPAVDASPDSNGSADAADANP